MPRNQPGIVKIGQRVTTIIIVVGIYQCIRKPPQNLGSQSFQKILLIELILAVKRFGNECKCIDERNVNERYDNIIEIHSITKLSI